VLDLCGATSQLAGGALVVGQALGGDLARQRLPRLREDVRRDRLDVAAQLLAVAAGEVGALLGRGELGHMTLCLRAQFELVNSDGLGKRCLARDLRIAAHERPASDRAERDSKYKQGKCHRHLRVPIRERIDRGTARGRHERRLP
jgi:hypothetical protein